MQTTVDLSDLLSALALFAAPLVVIAVRNTTATCSAIEQHPVPALALVAFVCVLAAVHSSS